MKVFVTGGTGFIGSHFINLAHAAGHELIAQRRSTTSSPRVPLAREPQWITKPLDQLLPEDLDGCHALVHLAAHSANVPYDTLERCIEENVLNPIIMLRAAVSANVKRFIIAGSCFEYGTSGTRYEFIPTDAPLEPTASYPASKAAATVAFHAFAQETNTEFLFLRIFQVYGEGEQEGRFWPSLRDAAQTGGDLEMTEGRQIRDFVPVETVANAFLTALDRTDLLPGIPRIEHVGSGKAQTLAQFAASEWRRLGATGRLLLGAKPMRVNEVMRYVPEIRMDSTGS